MHGHTKMSAHQGKKAFLFRAITSMKVFDLFQLDASYAIGECSEEEFCSKSIFLTEFYEKISLFIQMRYKENMDRSDTDLAIMIVNLVATKDYKETRCAEDSIERKFLIAKTLFKKQAKKVFLDKIMQDLKSFKVEKDDYRILFIEKSLAFMTSVYTHFALQADKDVEIELNNEEVATMAAGLVTTSHAIRDCSEEVYRKGLDLYKY